MPWKQLDEPTDDEKRKLDLQYRDKARFLVDESAGIEVARFLKARGYNVKFVEELGLLGRSDEDVFARAWKDKRILITHDTDFLDNRRFPPHRNPGIIVVRPGASGHEDYELLTCLVKALNFIGKRASWLRAKKVDFASDELLTIMSTGTRERYLWRRHGMPMIWED